MISRSVDVGQTVAASLSAPTLFLIAEDLTKMQVDTSVAEADIGKLKPDMDATFTVDAYPSKQFKGKSARSATRPRRCRTSSPTTRSSTSATRAWSCGPG